MDDKRAREDKGEVTIFFVMSWVTIRDHTLRCSVLSFVLHYILEAEIQTRFTFFKACAQDYFVTST